METEYELKEKVSRLKATWDYFSDTRPRKVAYVSFWYGEFLACAIVHTWYLLFGMTSTPWGHSLMAVGAFIVAKWCHLQHPLKETKPNSHADET